MLRHDVLLDSKFQSVEGSNKESVATVIAERRAIWISGQCLRAEIAYSSRELTKHAEITAPSTHVDFQHREIRLVCSIVSSER